jgi:tetratricopeptide (TPR) repeat protein
MPFTVEDFQDLLRLLEQQPQWKSALRTVLLDQEFLQLPGLVRELAEAQRQTEQRVAQLAEAQRQTEHRVAQLAEAQRHTEERLGRLEQVVAHLAQAQQQTEHRVAQLAEAQRHTEERLGRLEQVVAHLAQAQQQTEHRVAQLAEAQRRTEETVRVLVQEVGALKADVGSLKADVGSLKADVGSLKRDVGSLKGEALERRYRERAAGYFQRILRRIRVVDHQELGLLLDDALDAGRISPEERADVLAADVVVAGVWDGQEVYLVAEVSGRVTAHDVRRARHRAEVLQRAVGKPVLAAVAGEALSEDPETRKEAAQIWRVLDGRTDPPAGV